MLSYLAPKNCEILKRTLIDCNSLHMRKYDCLIKTYGSPIHILFFYMVYLIRWILILIRIVKVVIFFLQHQSIIGDVDPR